MSYNKCPGGGMGDAGDLKSPGPKGPCRFESCLGHIGELSTTASSHAWKALGPV